MKRWTGLLFAGTIGVLSSTVALADLAPPNRECAADAKAGDACDNHRQPGVCEPGTCYHKHGGPHPCFKCVQKDCSDPNDPVDNPECLLDGGIGVCGDAGCGVPVPVDDGRETAPPKTGCRSVCTVASVGDAGPDSSTLMAFGLGALGLARRRRRARRRADRDPTAS